jgi:hypothetical protein
MATTQVTSSVLADDAVTTDAIADDAVTLAKMASGTDGNLISYDASGNPAAVATGSSGQVLTSQGAGAAPVFAAPADTITIATEQATTSGTAIDFTSIPSGVKRITVMLAGVSLSGTDELILQIGDSGGLETSGYVSAASAGANVQNQTTGFALTEGSAAAQAWHGAITLSLEDASGRTWVAAGNLAAASAVVRVSAGGKSLSAELDRLRLTTDGSDTFDAGAVAINYES